MLSDNYEGIATDKQDRFISHIQEKLYDNPKYTERDTGTTTINKGIIGIKSRENLGFYMRWVKKNGRTGRADITYDKLFYKAWKKVTIETTRQESPLKKRAYDSDSPPPISRSIFSKPKVNMPPEVTPGDIPTPKLGN